MNLLVDSTTHLINTYPPITDNDQVFVDINNPLFIKLPMSKNLTEVLMKKYNIIEGIVSKNKYYKKKKKS